MTGPVHLHQTDDQGFPLCRCDACKEKSKIRNAQEIARMFGGIVKMGHDEYQEWYERSQDYEEQGGMKP